MWLGGGLRLLDIHFNDDAAVFFVVLNDEAALVFVIQCPAAPLDVGAKLFAEFKTGIVAGCLYPAITDVKWFHKKTPWRVALAPGRVVTLILGGNTPRTPL